MVAIARLARALYESGAIIFGDFILASGIRSKYYIDLAATFTSPAAFSVVVSSVASVLRTLEPFDYVAGVPLRGLPLASVVAFKLGKPFVAVRKERKEHGTGKLVEGNFSSGVAVAVDDVATTGSSILDAVEKLRASGLEVRDAVVVVDREQGAAEALAEASVTLHAAAKVSDIVKALGSLGLITQEEVEAVIESMKVRRRASA